MKIHRPVAEHVVTVLMDVFGEGYQADKVIERVFKHNKQLGARDRRFIAETSYDIIRHWRLLWMSMGRSEPTLKEFDLMRVIGVYLILRGSTQLPPWGEFQTLDAKRILASRDSFHDKPAIRESIPDWLYELGKLELGGKWDSWLSKLNEVAPVCLRANRLKVGRGELKKRLAAEDIVVHDAPKTEDGLILEVRQNVFKTKAFEEGLFEIQDGASQQVAPMLDPKPSERVIDACAGGGGKTLHIAAMMKNKGRIIAMDVNEKKLKALRERCSRNGVDIAEVKVVESNKTIKRLEKTADRVLLDVPCSGLGVLRRNPDKKWRLSMEEIEKLRQLQAEILENYSVMTKPGGRMVYATCSILPSENEKQIEAFLAKHGDEWKLVEEKKFVPGENGFDGFYAAALQRSEKTGDPGPDMH
ncbi:MAG: RsmB/NOP family class I SAM-dependent RNA methyltransferase [Bdellovibrionota bacterium]